MEIYILFHVKREYEQRLIAGGSYGIYMSNRPENSFDFLFKPFNAMYY